MHEWTTDATPTLVRWGVDEQGRIWTDHGRGEMVEVTDPQEAREGEAGVLDGLLRLAAWSASLETALHDSNRKLEAVGAGMARLRAEAAEAETSYGEMREIADRYEFEG